MTRSRLALVLLIVALAVGCEQSSAVPNSLAPASPGPALPEPIALESPLPEESSPRFTAHKLVATKSEESTIPQVTLSKQHAKWCVSKVGDLLPATELPRLDGTLTKLSDLFGKRATIVVFWTSDRWMSRMAWEDLVHEVAQYDRQEIAVVGIAVGPAAAAAARKMVGEVKADFPQLLDASGSALAEVGSVALPRLYVVDASGKIVWFDIEYSESTRRELARTLGVLVGTD